VGDGLRRALGRTSDPSPRVDPCCPRRSGRSSSCGPISRCRAGLSGVASLHYVDAKGGLDTWLTPHLLTPLTDDGPTWADAWLLGMSEVALADAPVDGAAFCSLPASAARPASYASWQKSALAHLVRDRPLTLLAAPQLGLVSRVGEAREAFVARATHALHEGRDGELETLASKWQPKIDKAREKVEPKKRRLAEASADGTTTMVTSGLEIGATVLGAMFGSGRRSVATGAARAVRSARSAARRTATKEAAQAELTAAEEALAKLEASVKSALDEIAATWRPENLVIEDKRVAAKKAEARVEKLELTWVGVG